MGERNGSSGKLISASPRPMVVSSPASGWVLMVVPDSSMITSAKRGSILVGAKTAVLSATSTSSSIVRVPHAAQNCAVGVRGAPHFSHESSSSPALSRVPQVGQNRNPAAAGALHPGQIRPLEARGTGGSEDAVPFPPATGREPAALDPLTGLPQSSQKRVSSLFSRPQ